MPLEKWVPDNVHSDISFSVRHMMVSKVRGHFRKWSGSLSFDEADPAASRLEVSIEAASIDTAEPPRDEHLRSADFLDAARYPALTFVATAVEKLGGQEFKVTGDLTIRGVTRPVVLDTEYFGRSKDPWGGERAGFSAKTSISRKDYGLEWNVALETGGFLVGDRVDINLEIEALKAP
jgi:polyisoprenoid-binding protein YceI